MTDAAAPPPDRPTRRPRRVRDVEESLLSVALGLEAAVVVFVAFTAFGLRVLPPAVAFGGGAALIVVMILVSSQLRHRWAVYTGWVLQAVLIATGFLLPVMFFIGAGFAGIWIWCFVKARQIVRDRGTPPPSSATPSTSPSNPPEGTP